MIVMNEYCAMYKNEDMMIAKDVEFIWHWKNDGKYDIDELTICYV